MSLRQAAQQALDWLEDDAATTVDEAYRKERQIADSLRAALAEHDRLAGIEAIEKTAGIHVSQQAEPDSDYERGFVDGMNLQTKGSVDKAVNRIAEPEQEPVAWVVYDTDNNDIAWSETGKRLKAETPLYTAPTPRKPLTDEEMRECAQAMNAEPLAEGWPELIKFARAIERAHGIGEKT